MILTCKTVAEETTHVDAYARRIFTLPLMTRLLSLFGVTLLTIVTVILIILAVLAFTMQWTLGLFVAMCAVFTGALTDYVWRDLRGKWGLRIVLDADTVTLDLPAGRSLIHRPPAQHITMPYVDIEAVEARFEAYRSQGMEIMQRAYVLRRKSGELIFLFEERALATAMESSMFKEIVADLTDRAEIKLSELGMVEGRGGLLSVWGTHAPDWAAPALPRARQMWLWQHAASTGSLAVSIVILVILIMRYFGTG